MPMRRGPGFSASPKRHDMKTHGTWSEETTSQVFKSLCLDVSFINWLQMNWEAQNGYCCSNSWLLLRQHALDATTDKARKTYQRQALISLPADLPCLICQFLDAKSSFLPGWSDLCLLPSSAILPCSICFIDPSMDICICDIMDCMVWITVCPL